MNANKIAGLMTETINIWNKQGRDISDMAYLERNSKYEYYCGLVTQHEDGMSYDEIDRCEALLHRLEVLSEYH